MSNLRKLIRDEESVTLADAPEIAGHEVHSVASDDAELMLNVRSTDILKDIYGDAFVGIVDVEQVVATDASIASKCINDLKVGEYGAVNSDNKLEVYTAVEKVIKGWVSNETVSEPLNIGYITYLPVRTVLPELKKQYEELQANAESSKAKLEVAFQEAIDHQKSITSEVRRSLENQLNDLTCASEIDASEVNALKSKLKELTAQLALEQEVVTSRSAECKRLIRDNASLRDAGSLDTETIIKLNDELGNLRKKLSSHAEVVPTRFDFSSGTHRLFDQEFGGCKTPIHIATSNNNNAAKSIPDASYDSCIGEIKAFDIQSLISREMRDLRRNELAERREKLCNRRNIIISRGLKNE